MSFESEGIPDVFPFKASNSIQDIMLVSTQPKRDSLVTGLMLKQTFGSYETLTRLRFVICCNLLETPLQPYNQSACLQTCILT